MTEPIAQREYYSIGEVCELVDLKPHVLRYWETQFPVLNPSKNRSGNRVYQRKEIKLILLVKQLLYDEKYTIEGAKQKLDQLRRGGRQRLDAEGEVAVVVRDEQAHQPSGGVSRSRISASSRRSPSMVSRSSAVDAVGWSEPPRRS